VYSGANSKPPPRTRKKSRHDVKRGESGSPNTFKRSREKQRVWRKKREGGGGLLQENTDIGTGQVMRREVVARAWGKEGGDLGGSPKNELSGERGSSSTKKKNNGEEEGDIS